MLVRFTSFLLKSKKMPTTQGRFATKLWAFSTMYAYYAR